MVVPTPPAKTNIFMDEVLNFLAEAPTAEQILAFKPSEALTQRSEYLFDRNRNVQLTAEEKSELDEFLRLNHFVNMLKIRTRQSMN